MCTPAWVSFPVSQVSNVSRFFFTNSSFSGVIVLQIRFSGTVQIQERQKTAEKVRLNEFDGVKDLLQRHVDEQTPTDRVSGQNGCCLWLLKDLAFSMKVFLYFDSALILPHYDNDIFISIKYEHLFFLIIPQVQNLDDLDEHVVISLLTDVVGKLQRENQKLSSKQAQIQVSWWISYKSELTQKPFNPVEVGSTVLFHPLPEKSVPTQTLNCDCREPASGCVWCIVKTFFFGQAHYNYEATGYNISFCCGILCFMVSCPFPCVKSQCFQWFWLVFLTNSNFVPRMMKFWLFLFPLRPREILRLGSLRQWKLGQTHFF